MGASDFPDFEPTYKGVLKFLRSFQNDYWKRYSKQEINEAFEEIVTWCIKGETEKVKKAYSNYSKPVYKDLFESAYPRDVESGLKIREIVSVMGHVELMSFILQSCTPKTFNFDKYLNIALRKEAVKMVECILKETKSVLYYLQRRNMECFDHILGNNEIFQLYYEYLMKEKEEHGHGYKYVDFGYLFKSIASNYNELSWNKVKFLLEKDANPNANLDELGNTLLHKAVENADIQKVMFLLDNGAGMFMRNRALENPLQVIQKKLKKYCESHVLDVNSSYPFTYVHSMKDIIKLLSSRMEENQQSVDINYKATFDGLAFGLGTNNWTLTDHNTKTFQELVTCCLNGDVHELKIIHAQRHSAYALHHAQDLHTGYRAIDFAAKQGHVEVVRQLMKMGATAETRDWTRENNIIHSAIDIANSNDHLEVCRCLFEHGVDKKDQMVIAVQKGLLKIAEFLLDKVDIDIIGSRGYNALHQAAIDGNLEFVQFFLNNGADINKKSCFSWTKVSSALQLAITHNHGDVIKYLIDQGAETNGESVPHIVINTMSSCQDGEQSGSNMGEVENPGSRNKKRNLEESSDSDTASSSGKPKTKSRKTQTVDKNSTNETLHVQDQDNQENPSESTNSEQIRSVVQPLLESFLKENFSYQTKLITLSENPCLD